MPLTHIPTRPMVRVSEPGDIGRALRYAGRVAYEASLSGARMHDVADVVRTLAISLVLDACGGWIGLRDLGTLGGQGVEVVAFDRRCAHSEAGEMEAHEWRHLHRLGHLDATVVSHRTPHGGTALWACLSDEPGSVARAAATTPEVSGLLQAQPGEPRAGWIASVRDHHLGILICEAISDDPLPVSTTQRLLRTHPAAMPSQFDQLYRLPEGLDEVAAAVIDIDLANRVVRATGAGNLSLTLVADGVPARPADDGMPILRTSLRWENSLTVVAHTAGIARGEEVVVADDVDGAHVALTCAALMRDAREPTPTACVVAARVAGSGQPSESS